MADSETILSLEDRSKLAFGNKVRLPVLGAVGRYSTEPGVTFQAAQIIEDLKELRGTRIRSDKVLAQLEILADLEFAVEVPPEMASVQPENEVVGARTFARVEHRTWPYLMLLVESWDNPPQRQLDLFEI